MKRLKLAIFSAAAASLLITGPLMMNAAMAAPQSKCPVMGLKTDKDVFVDYQGKRIYFCCTSCVEEFKANPSKYMEKLQKDGVVLEDAPKK